MSQWLGGLLNRAAAAGGLDGRSRQQESEVSADTLLDRIANDQLSVDDKQHAISQLTSLGKHMYQAVGSRIPLITKLMQANSNNIELLRESIELLTSIILCNPVNDNIIQIHNTELFINDKSNFAVIFNVLNLTSDHYVRYSVCTFLKTLLTNRFESVQESILACPMSVTSIMGLLKDSREVIRNEALLVLTDLTKSNQEIQKIIAFDGGFEILQDIIRIEGQSEGGIVVNDCITILNNLLKGNVLNQNFFREMGCIPKLAPLLQVQNTDMWILSDNKFSIIMSTLDLILSLVERNNLSTPANQQQISHCSMMNLIIRLGLGKMSSQFIRSKALYTLGEIINMNPENIAEFSAVSIKSELNGQSQSALLKLTLVLLHSKDLIEKQSAAHVFKCYLTGNEEAQMALASTITPPAPGDDDLSIGQHLVRALFSWEMSTTQSSTPSPASPTANTASLLANMRIDINGFWYSSMVIIYTLRDSTHAKEQMLKAVVEIPKSTATAGSGEQQPLTLFQKLMAALLATKKQQDIDPLIKIALLKILSIWLDKSPRVVTEFFKNGSHLSFIVESILQPITSTAANSLQVHIQGLFTAVLAQLMLNLDENNIADRNNLSSIINHRIGLNSFKEKMDTLRKTDQFTHAEQGEEPFQTALDKISIQLFDFDYTIFFKDICDKVRLLGTNMNKPRPGTRPSSAQSVTSPNTASSPPSSSPAVPHISKEQQQHLENENALLKKKIEEMELQHQQQQQQQKLSTPGNQSPLPPVVSIPTPTAPAVVAQPEPVTVTPVQQQQPTTEINNQNQENTQLINELQMLIEEKDKENRILSEAMSKLEDLILEKDDKLEELSNQIWLLNQQLQQEKQQNEQLQLAQSSQNNNSMASNDSNVDIFELMRLRQENVDYDAKLKSFEKQVNDQHHLIQTLKADNQQLILSKEEIVKKSSSSPPVPTSPSNVNNLVLAKVESELAELKIKYSSLQKDQDEIMDWATKLEVENSTLKAQLGK
ncbi:hypothetical protein PPL_01932 [Heterostelium album PN500]|uniref:Vesicle tethering protein Uso1/P115-like head domain-containing protein n=1 Tax=Heterostelium pallidum (strain ATCC 26659 / Pp 5 / PN500) TaxID=670386 RepID=D3B0W5_HETP5|nr:hypothetical protein PPL_01932 [Heterostelium album PN500]EFA84939.1 hypothetical protein PPL_01932 [Heterostelium album PN500]|eukprot:XP_020437049.1 hypothetical protein PPL_01932 [Heterostelium album PN500]